MLTGWLLLLVLVLVLDLELNCHPTVKNGSHGFSIMTPDLDPWQRFLLGRLGICSLWLRGLAFRLHQTPFALQSLKYMLRDLLRHFIASAHR